MLVTIFFMGLGILTGAIVVNVLAKILGLKTWYDFLNKEKVLWYDYVFLFVIYPLLLGLISYTAYRLLF